MIKVKYKINDDNKIIYLDVKGHANYALYGEDLICASVSSIVFGLLNGLDEHKDNIQIKELKNHIEVINNSNSEIVYNYLELAIIQLKTIEESYAEYIKIERI